MTRMPYDGPEGALASNLRDLGGIPLAGGAVRHGLVYRSEAPRALQAGVLEELKLRTVLDLRAPEERQRDHGRITNLPVEVVTFPSAAVLGAATVDAVAQRAVEGRVGDLMADLYRDFPEALAPAIGEAARSVVEGRAPILIHCAAGKDRTGFVCAVLLHLVGAEPESVVAEYLRSNVFFDEQRIIALLAEDGVELPTVAVEALLCQPFYLEASFDVMREQAGSVEAYMAQEGGITPELRRELSSALLG